MRFGANVVRMHFVSGIRKRGSSAAPLTVRTYSYSGAKNKSNKAHLGHFLEFTISNSEFEN